MVRRTVVPRRGKPRTRRPWWFVTVCLVGLTLVGPVAAAAAAPLQPLPPDTPGDLSLSSSAVPLVIPSLSPGQSFSWQVQAQLSGRTSGSLEVQVSAGGTRAAGEDGYRARLQTCAEPWTDADGVGAVPVCAGGATEVVAPTPLVRLTPAPATPLPTLTPQNPVYVAITLDLPMQTTQRAAVGTLTLAIRFTAAGDDPAGAEPGVTGGSGGYPGGAGGPGLSGYPGSPGYPAAAGGPGGTGGTAPVDGTLSWTGFALLPFLALGLGAVVLGLLLALVGRRSRTRTRTVS